MNEPTPQNNPSLDSESRTQLRIIALETSVQKFENECYKGLATITELDKRVKELEIARLAQRQLNTTFALKEPVKEPTPKKSLKRLWW